MFEIVYRLLYKNHMYELYWNTVISITLIPHTGED